MKYRVDNYKKTLFLQAVKALQGAMWMTGWLPAFADLALSGADIEDVLA